MIVINPIMGGGLSNAKLALADAVAANVLSGKKFYSKDKALKTGTLDLPKVMCGSFSLSYLATSRRDINLGFESIFAVVLAWVQGLTGKASTTIFLKPSYWRDTTSESGRYYASALLINNNTTLQISTDTIVDIRYYAIG